MLTMIKTKKMIMLTLIGLPQGGDRLVGLVVKAFASRAADMGFNSRFRLWGFFGVESNEYSRGYAARRLAS